MSLILTDLEPSIILLFFFSSKYYFPRFFLLFQVLRDQLRGDESPAGCEPVRVPLPPRPVLRLSVRSPRIPQPPNAGEAPLPAAHDLFDLLLHRSGLVLV